LDLCAKANILPDVHQITADKIDWAWEQLEKNADGIRYVIDIKKSLENKAFLP
jgi:D-arabinose 1-dehydrogenase-like Zn-dependent alcohol dehydrogenase